MYSKQRSYSNDYKEILNNTRRSAGYKTPKEIELEKKLYIAVKALQYYTEGILGGSFATETLKKLEEVTTKPIKERRNK